MERIQRALELARKERELNPVTASVAAVRPQPAVQAATPLRTVPVPLQEEHLERHRILTSKGNAPAREAYRMLRTQVLQRMREHALQTLAVVSPASGDGKSLTAANLAVSIAEDANRTALLVDLDLRRPSVATLFGLKPERGFDDYLRGACRLEEVFCRTEPFERLAILPVRIARDRSSDLLSGTAMRDVVAEIKGRYPDRVVIFDLPPVLASDDALAFSPLIDAALIVAAEGRTRREDLVRTLELLRSTRIIGTVLNNSAIGGARVY